MGQRTVPVAARQKSLTNVWLYSDQKDAIIEAGLEISDVIRECMDRSLSGVLEDSLAHLAHSEAARAVVAGNAHKHRLKVSEILEQAQDTQE